MGQREFTKAVSEMSKIFSKKNSDGRIVKYTIDVNEFKKDVKKVQLIIDKVNQQAINFSFASREQAEIVTSSLIQKEFYKVYVQQMKDDKDENVQVYVQAFERRIRKLDNALASYLSDAEIPKTEFIL